MATKPLPSQEVLRQFLRYEPDTGKLFWQARVPSELFNSRKGERIWHTKYAGKEAFTSRHGQGYRVGEVRGQLMLAHRVIVTMLGGDIGDAHVDHINGVRDDNRAINLRLATPTENMRNASMWSHNTSGHIGVVWHRNNQKWGARIKVSGKSIHIGLFDSKDEAIAARKAAEIEFNFHPNHGRKPIPQQP